MVGGTNNVAGYSHSPLTMGQFVQPHYHPSFIYPLSTAQDRLVPLGFPQGMMPPLGSAALSPSTVRAIGSHHRQPLLKPISQQVQHSFPPNSQVWAPDQFGIGRSNVHEHNNNSNNMFRGTVGKDMVTSVKNGIINHAAWPSLAPPALNLHAASSNPVFPITISPKVPPLPAFCALSPEEHETMLWQQFHHQQQQQHQPYPQLVRYPTANNVIAPPLNHSRSSVSTTLSTASSLTEENNDDDPQPVPPPPPTARKSSPKRAKLSVDMVQSDDSHPTDNGEMGLGGESRLKINFSSLGNPGEHPQVFGKSRLGVPDNVIGTYILYSERWRSEIVHEKNTVFESEDGTRHVLVTWKITNLTTGVTQSRTETPKEAILRHKDGRTLCNKVFRKALEHRASELEAEVSSETNPIRTKTIRNLIKKLRPKHFSEGPLVFGLRHECVQNRFKSMTEFDDRGLLRIRQS